MPRLSITRILAGTTIAASLAGTAAAHHGWSWAQADQIDLKGTIQSISFAPPHPTLEVKADDGVWRVELGNPNQTQRSGFVEGQAKVGDQITATGNRSEDRSEKRLKAVRIVVSGKTFDIYPERIKTN
ncbi:DUF6152 family protein [Neorhizobium galegae]|uniref:DUF6152 family protein n=1 Tax=Neorhizobium galegae TaxID=399 RepID=UPI0006217609|nr:DUF6152 family protein [Neorhizobium galegae]CDZ29488.1 Hypothetical protein NGAL_HAMBI490_43550 [Neorhizobium galegae bv. officinalis]KAA9386241.1 hypothetical protein F4V88_07035 [Neorhizobium galegae]KAB1113315.1 hypothetical protein F4V89_11335 [Neorhizobium galegae]MCM2496261.1 DUF6152 family protein [Neorhizobium galegae]MCQ1770603.1 DUF6152 family protein [Neorhizobium galegae]